MTKLSRSLAFEAKAKVRPLMKVSTGAPILEMLLWPCRITKEKLNNSSSSLFTLNRKEGKGDVGEDSGSWQASPLVKVDTP